MTTEEQPSVWVFLFPNQTQSEKVFQQVSQGKGNFIKSHSGIRLESMLHVIRAKTVPSPHYQQPSQMSICPLFLTFPFTNCRESCWEACNAWQVITEQSRAEQPQGTSSNLDRHQTLTLHGGGLHEISACESKSNDTQKTQRVITGLGTHQL